MNDYHHGERMSGDRMSRVSEGTIESEEASQRTPDPPHLWKADGSGKDNASHRSGRRSVTFSQEEGARMSYFSVQEPWVLETIRKGTTPRSMGKDEESSRKTHCTSDSSSAIKRTSEHTEQLQCEDTKPSQEEPIELSFHDYEREEQKNLESSEDDTDMDMNESRSDPAQTTQSSFASDIGKSAGSFYQPPSNLHDICYNALTPSDLFTFYESLPSSPSRTALKDLSMAASQLDRRGRTPLHIISENSALSDTTFPTDDDAFPGLEPSPSSMTDEKQVKTFVLDLLLAANPMAMKQKDANGLIPFERVFIEWVHRMHNVDSPKHHQRWGLSSRGFSSYSQLSAPSKIQHMWNNTSSHVTNAMSWAGKSLPFKADSLRSMDEERSPKKSNRKGLSKDSGDVDDELENFSDDALDHFPSHVHLTPRVKFAITMVSTILDHFDEHVFSRSFRRRALLNYRHSNERRSNGSDFKCDPFDVAMEDLQNYRFTEPSDKITADVIDEIAAIPYLVKTFLLLTDDDEREWVFSTTLFQRVAMNKNSIGPWLTGMLQSSKKGVQQRGLGYLGYLSHTLEAHSGWGVRKQKSSSHLGRSSGAHDELHEKLSDLEGFIPSLLTLDQRGIEEAATTLVVRKMLDRMISRPFAVSVILLDAVFLTLLIISFRAAVSIFLTGGSAGTVLSWIYVSNSCTFYFIIRELGSVITILERTRGARIYFLSFWNLTDMLSIILALASTIAIRVKFKKDEIDYSNLTQLRACLAVTTGLLWLRVLSLLKSINMQLATFVLAIFQITRDIMWFLLILLTLVVAFAQMFYSILVPPECAFNESPPDGLGCKSAEYYLKTYSILLGDFGHFDRDNFETAFSVLLVVAFSFMVVIVLLNVLIAIVSDSYEKCLIRSKCLFGRARVMLIAELGSFQHLLQTDSRNLVEAPESLYSQWWHGRFGFGVQRYSRSCSIFYFLSGFVVLIWFTAETAGFFTGKRVGNYALSLCSILVNVLLFLGIVALLSHGASSFHQESARRVIRGGCFGFIWQWYHDVVQKAMLRLLGSDRESSSFFKKNLEPDPWSGRVHFLSQEMTRLAEESTAQMKEHAKAMERSVHLSETRLRSEINTAEEKISGLKGEILNELRRSEERMQEMMLHSMTDLLRALVGEEDDLE